MQNIRSRCFTESEKLLFCRAQLTGVSMWWHPNIDRKMCFFLGPSKAFYTGNAYLTCHLAFSHSAELFRGTPPPVFWSFLECAGTTWGTKMPLLLSEYMEILTPKLISVWIYKLGITTSSWTWERNKLLLPEMKSTWPIGWWQHQNQLQVTACGCHSMAVRLQSSESPLPPQPRATACPSTAACRHAFISQESYTTSLCRQRSLSSTAASPAGFL